MSDVLVVGVAILAIVLGPFVLVIVLAAAMWLIMLVASPSICLFEGSTDHFWDLFGGRPRDRERARMRRNADRWQAETDAICGRRGPGLDRPDLDPPEFAFDEPDLLPIEWPHRTELHPKPSTRETSR